MRKFAATVVLGLVSVFGTIPQVSARPVATAAVGVAAAPKPSPVPDTRGTFEDGGARVDIQTRAGIRALADEAARAVAKPGPRWAYDYKYVCRDTETECGSALYACRDEAAGAVETGVFRRQVDENNEPIGGVDAPWDNLGTTCFANGLPGADLPSMGEILAAFRRVQFTKPELSIQPVGNLTLVNLPTYFETKYPQAGLGPGEIDESSLLANRVQIRVLAQSLNYVYGDGSVSGPTRSMGGPYPQGDIRYTYPRKGDFATRVDVTYGGQFRIGEGPWMPIPEVVTIEGTPEPLLVCEARARLVSEFDDGRTGNQFEPNTPCSIRAQQNQAQRANGTSPTP